MRLRGIVAGMLCWLALCFASQPSSWKLSQFQRRVWQIEDGLPHNYVTSVATDAKGYLLLGTQSGIARFDGMRFRPFERFGGMWIYSLLTASDGSLWVGGYQGGLHRVASDGSERSWSASDGIAEGTIFSMLEDRAHHIWLVSPGGLMRVDDGRPRMIVKGANTGGYSWQSMTEDASGAIWLASASGLARVSAAGEVSWPSLRDVQGSPVTIYFDRVRSQLFLGTTSGLYELACTSDRCEGKTIAGVGGPVVAVHRGADGSLWAATWGNGLFRSTGTNAERLTTRDGLADDFVRVLSEDGEHNLWAGTRSGGLTRFRRTIFKPVGIAEGLGGNYASAVLGDGGDGLWLGTWRGGLFHWRAGVLTQQPLPEQPLGVIINALALDNTHSLWIGTLHGLLKIAAGASAAVEVPLPGGEGNVNHLLAAHDGALWIAKRGSDLFEFHSGRRILPGETIAALFEDRQRTIWIGTARGLWRMREGGRVEQLDAAPITAITEDGRGRIWTATDSGALRIHTDGKPLEIRTSGLPSQAFIIAADAQNGLWLGTGRGVFRFALSDVDEFLSGSRARVELISYGTSEGMRTIECRVGAQPSNWRQSDGTVWLPTAKGFIEIDPAEGRAPAPLRAWVEQVQVDGKLQAGPVRLPAGAHELAVSYTAIRLARAERVQFRYRMEGLDQDWVEAGGERIARYSNLRPGRFRLLVSARDPGGAWTDAVASEAIEQLPFVYQTNWFRALALFALAACIGLLYRLRLHAVRRRYAAVVEERNRIAREWHDTLLAGLAAASWQLDVAADQCRESTAFPSVQSALGMVRYCRDEARRAIGDLRHEPGHDPGREPIAPRTLAELLKESVAQLTDGTAVRALVEVEGEVPACSSELNSDLLRICQEATANALRHARASQLVVRLECAGGKISVSVQDDGVGIGSSTIEHPPHGHYGLLGMRERAQRFGGELYLSHVPGGGTLVKAVVPLEA